MGDTNRDGDGQHALVQQCAALRRRLAEEGMEIALNPDAPVAEQYAQLVEALWERLAQCRHHEQAYQHSRLLLTEAEKLSHTGAWEWDLTTNQWTFSDEWLAIHGTTRRTMTPDELLTIAHPDDRTRVQQAFDDVRRGIKPYDLLHRIIRQDTGEERVVRANGQFVRDATGTVVRVYGFVQDITEQQHAEEARRESEERYRALFANMTEGFALGEAILDAAGRPVNFRFLEANEAFFVQTGLPRDVLGKPVTEALPQIESYWIERYTGVAMTGVPVHFTEYNADTRRYYDVYCYRPAPERFAILFRDVTQQRRAEEALRESEINIKEAEEALRVVFNSTYDALILHELDGHITDANETFLRMYGVADVAQARTLSVMNLSSVAAPLENLPRIWTRALAGEAQLFEWKAKRNSDRQEFDVEVFLRSIHLHGRQLMLANVRDITERKRNEEALQQFAATLEERVRERTAALEAANKELEAFSYSVSHDLRAPLRSIDGFSKVLLEKYAGNIDATGQDYLDRVRNAAVRMGRLIDDMLNLSRIGRQEMHRVPVPLSDIAEAVIADLRQRDPERQVLVEVQPGLKVSGDPGLLRIVLENLLGNAWKFTSKTAEARIEVGVTTRDGATLYYVRDNGAGFDMRYADKLFTPFQRLHTEDEFPGTGIGLAIVQRIITRHGGRVWAEGREGAGATVYFTLGET